MFWKKEKNPIDNQRRVKLEIHSMVADNEVFRIFELPSNSTDFRTIEPFKGLQDWFLDRYSSQYYKWEVSGGDGTLEIMLLNKNNIDKIIIKEMSLQDEIWL